VIVSGTGPWQLSEMGATIRPATRDDLSAVQEIVRAAYTHYIDRIGREPGPMLDDYAALIADARVYVGERADGVQGILVLLPRDGAMLLDNVAVAPAAQGSGLGRLLLEFAERSAIEQGYGTIKLYTNEAMTENIALYEKIGYTQTHRAEENGLRRVYMRKTLSVA
jgi:ribosomal protein S18 acetylase RimI-like enzyme